MLFGLLRWYQKFSKNSLFAKRHFALTVGFLLGWQAFKMIQPSLYHIDEWMNSIFSLIPYHESFFVVKLKLIITKVGLVITAAVVVHILGTLISIVLRSVILPALDSFASAYIGNRARSHAGDTP
ncbi:MAG: hypothetical protein WCW14_00265 [Candidatus Paceibacterota bacterium]|jgi:hypothetical protein